MICDKIINLLKFHFKCAATFSDNTFRANFFNDDVNCNSLLLSFILASSPFSLSTVGLISIFSASSVALKNVLIRSIGEGSAKQQVKVIDIPYKCQNIYHRMAFPNAVLKDSRLTRIQTTILFPEK